MKIGKIKNAVTKIRNNTMNEHTLKGEWKQVKGSVKQKWADLTDDDLMHIDGSRDKLVGKVQERYGHGKDDAEREVDTWRAENKY